MPIPPVEPRLDVFGLPPPRLLDVSQLMTVGMIPIVAILRNKAGKLIDEQVLYSGSAGSTIVFFICVMRYAKAMNPVSTIRKEANHNANRHQHLEIRTSMYVRTNT